MNEDFLHKGVYCASLLTPSLRRHKLYRSIADFVTHISPTAWGRVDCPTHTKQYCRHIRSSLPLTALIWC